jgi:hypothetical protein
MGHLLRWVLPFVLLLHASCKRPVPSRTSGGSIAPATHEGYVDAGGGVQLFYRMVGASSDPVVVLHGGPGFTMDSFAATSSHWLGDTPSFSTTSAAPVGLRWSAIPPHWTHRDSLKISKRYAGISGSSG